MTSEAAIITISGRPQSDFDAGGPAALVERAQRGDAGAFEGLMRLHERRVLRIAWRLLGGLEDAQDAAQEVFLRLYRYLDRFDNRRALEPWLYRVTVNVCRDLGRRRRLRQAVPLDDSPEARNLPDGKPDPAARAAVAEERRIVEQALGTLADKERAAIVMRDVEGLSTREVAEVLECSEVTVRSHICRARLKIKEYRRKRLGRFER